MDKNTAPIAAQARALRTLCNDLAHGAAREGFVARLDDELARLAAETVRVVVVPLDGAREEATAAFIRELGCGDASAAGALTILTRDAHQQGAGNDVVQRELPSGASSPGIDRILVLGDPARVFASPMLLGKVIENCDVVVLAGRGTDVTDSVAGGIRRLGDATRHALRVGAGDPDAFAGRIEGAFRDVRACARDNGETSWLAALGRMLPIEQRTSALADAGAARLALWADLLNKQIQAEVALLKFRVADLARLRRGEDVPEAGGDAREQAEMLKATLEAWTNSCHIDLARMAEQGVLPFDSRLIANKLTTGDLLHREERAAAVIKYPILGSAVFHPLVTHHFTVLPNPAAVEQMRERLATALAAQAHKDVDTLNQRAQDLVSRLKANVPLYPSFATALAALRIPVLAPGAVDRPISGTVLESEAEDKFVRVGFFKRLMEGRMVASMAFSFLTMSAGVFVLFGDPSIKRGLMKFSGVIVIMMVLYFIFSLMVKGEEEHQELEEVLERVRARLNADVSRPLAKVQGALLKVYSEFVDDVAASVLEMVESVSRAKTADRARVMEQRKAEDEVVKSFLARRQPAAMGAAQKTAAFVTTLERARAEPARPSTALPAAPRPGALAAAPAPGAATAAPANGAAAPAPTLAERAAAARAQALERATATTAKPMSASERLALAKARMAGSAPSPAADPAPVAAAPSATSPSPAAAPVPSPTPVSVAGAPSVAAVAMPAPPRPAPLIQPTPADAPAAD